MVDIRKQYLMVSIDRMPEGFSVQAWINIDKPHPIDLIGYPHVYTYMGAHCTWFIYASSELTAKIIAMVGEQADRICIEGEASAKKRLAKNR